MRHTGQHPVERVLRRVILVRGERLLVRRDRRLPHPDHRVDVRRHVERVRRRRRDLRVLVRGGHAPLRQRREVVAVDQVMRDARVIRILLVERLEDLDRLQEIVHRLVIESLVQRQRVEDLRLDVTRILLRQGLHRLFVVLGAGVVVDPVVVLVVRLDRREPVALAFGLRADGLPLLDRVEPPLERDRIEGARERIGTDAHGEPPVRDGAAGVGLRDGRERFDRFGKEERVQHRERALELFLRLGRARRFEEHTSEFLAGRPRVIVGPRDTAEREGHGQSEDECDDPLSHVTFPIASRDRDAAARP